MNKYSGRKTPHNAWRIFCRDIRNIVHNPIALLVVMGLIILPSLYAWVNIYACWDPYGNTSGIKVAVVNLDQGTDLQGEYLNAGDKIVGNLRENDAIGWEFVDLEQAEYGLLHEEYYAMLEIPANFSATLVDVFGEQLVKPEIIYRVNEKSNAIAPKITDSGAKTVTNSVTTAIIEVVDQAAFSVGNEVGNGLDANKSKIQLLRDAILTVDSNFAELENSLATAEKSVEEVNALLDSADTCLPEIEAGIANLQQFSASSKLLLADAEQIRQEGIQYIEERFNDCRRLIEETRVLLAEADKEMDDVEQLRNKMPAVLERVEELQEKLTELLDRLGRLDIADPDYERMLAELNQANGRLTQLTNLLQAGAENPQRVQAGLITASKTIDSGLTAQLLALHTTEAELELRLAAATEQEEILLLQAELKKVQQGITDIEQLQQQNASYLIRLEEMTPEEVAAELDELIVQVGNMQQQLSQIIAVLEQLQASNVNFATIVDQLNGYNALLEQGIGKGWTMLDTVDDGLSLVDQYFALAEQTMDEVETAMDGLETQYANQWSGAIDGMLGDLEDTLANLDNVLTEADGAVPTLLELLATGRTEAGKGQEVLEQVAEVMPQARSDIERLSKAMAGFTDENLNMLIGLLDGDAAALSDHFSSPVQLSEERLYHLDNYGSAMTPFYTILAVWVGCIILSALLTTEAEPLEETGEITVLEEYFGKYILFVLLSQLQTLVLILGDKYLLGVTISDWPVFVMMSQFSAFVFITIVYTIVSIFGPVGKAICVVLLVLQLAGAGGTFPVEVMPEIYQVMKPHMPFAYAIGGLREAVAGILMENLHKDIIHLAVFWVGAMLLGLTLKKPLKPLLAWFERKLHASGITE